MIESPIALLWHNVVGAFTFVATALIVSLFVGEAISQR